MSIQPIDVPSLLRAVIWPLITVIVFLVFRRPLGDLVSLVGRRIQKFSFGGVSLELAQVSEMKPSQALEAEIRQLEAGLYPQSGAPGITGLLCQLQRGASHEYIVIDLGSAETRLWLTSRLYLLSLLLTTIDRPVCLAFVETLGGVRKRFLGLATPGRVRWALARKYSWLEGAGAAAYDIAGRGLPAQTSPVLQVQTATDFQLDPTTGFLSDYQLSQLVQQFLLIVRKSPAAPPPAPAPLLNSVTPAGGPIGTVVTLTGVRFGTASLSSSVTFGGTPALTTSWTDTEIVTSVPPGAVSGDVVVTAKGLCSNGVPFAVGAADASDWVLLANGLSEHAKWLDGAGVERLLGTDLNDSCVVLAHNESLHALGGAVLEKGGRFVAVLDPDKTFRGLVDRSAVLERLAREVAKQARSGKAQVL